MKYITIIAMALAMGVQAEPKFEFIGKVTEKKRINVGRGAAFGKIFREQLRIEIQKVTKGDLKPGVVVPLEIGQRRIVSPVPAKDVKVGQVYRFDALYKHPAHAEGLYLLDGRVHKVTDEAPAKPTPAKPAAQAGGDHKYLKAFPQAAEEMTRFVIELPHKTRAEEGAFKVELVVGKVMETDGVNRMFMGGKLDAKPLKGWGFTFYEAQLGSAASTLIGVPPGTPRVKKFVHGPSRLIAYNSRIPVVVYVPNDAQVRYRVWAAKPGLTEADNK